MENREGTLIWVGALAIGCLAYFYRQKKEERLEYVARKASLQNICQQTIENGSRIDFQKIKASGKKAHVFFPEITEYRLEEDTYKRFVRHLNNYEYFGREMGAVREGETGGRFWFRDPVTEREVVGEINDCKMEEYILSEQRHNNIVFAHNKNKITDSGNLTYKLKAAQRLALFGVIGYSISEQRFIFEPEFMVGGRESAEAVLQKLSSFWQAKIEKVALQKILLGFSILAVSYLFVYHPLKSMWSRYHSKFEGVSKDKLSHFISKAEISARTSSNLNCEICQASSVNIIYECGHLCVCEGCNEKNKSQQCPICKRVSAKSIKIFL